MKNHISFIIILLTLAAVGLIKANEEDTESSSKVVTTNLKLLGFLGKNGYAPIPKNAYPLNATSKDGMHVSALVPDVYFLTDTAYTNVVIDIGNDELFVVDAPPSFTTTRFKAAIASIAGTKKKVTHFMYSHSHNDHVGIAGAMFSKQNITIIAHELTANLLKRNPTQPQPKIMIKNNGTKMTIGNKKVVFYYYGNGHVDGNMAMWLPAEKILIYIDIVFPQWTPFYSLGYAQDVIRYIEQFDNILAYDFKYVVSGHLGRPVTLADVKLAKQFIDDMISYVIEGYKIYNVTVYYENFSGKAPSPNHWAVLHNWMGDMASYCASKLVKKYVKIMAAVDVYSWSGCWTLRHTYGLYYPNSKL